ncbi:MAG TPA: hypothetical protein VFR09_04055 [Alphaproteobacteria bacterium]|nr:hypothetical protein [Alphaproteobacteria bacterium]
MVAPVAHTNPPPQHTHTANANPPPPKPAPVKAEHDGNTTETRGKHVNKTA